MRSKELSRRARRSSSIGKIGTHLTRSYFSGFRPDLYLHLGLTRIGIHVFTAISWFAGDVTLAPGTLSLTGGGADGRNEPLCTYRSNDCNKNAATRNCRRDRRVTFGGRNSPPGFEISSFRGRTNNVHMLHHLRRIPQYRANFRHYSKEKKKQQPSSLIYFCAIGFINSSETENHNNCFRFSILF